MATYGDAGSLLRSLQQVQKTLLPPVLCRGDEWVSSLFSHCRLTFLTCGVYAQTSFPHLHATRSETNWGRTVSGTIPQRRSRELLPLPAVFGQRCLARTPSAGVRVDVLRHWACPPGDADPRAFRLFLVALAEQPQVPMLSSLSGAWQVGQVASLTTASICQTGIYGAGSTWPTQWPSCPKDSCGPCRFEGIDGPLQATGKRSANRPVSVGQVAECSRLAVTPRMPGICAAGPFCHGGRMVGRMLAGFLAFGVVCV